MLRKFRLQAAQPAVVEAVVPALVVSDIQRCQLIRSDDPCHAVLAASNFLSLPLQLRSDLIQRLPVKETAWEAGFREVEGDEWYRPHADGQVVR